MFTTVEKFLKKFENVRFIKDDHGTIIGTLANNEIAFSIDTKLANSNHDFDAMPVQVIARVLVNGVYAGTWGAADLKDCSALVKFYQEIKAEARSNERELQKKAEDDVKLFYDNL